jgi:hypothetical protein
VMLYFGCSKCVLVLRVHRNCLVVVDPVVVVECKWPAEPPAVCRDSYPSALSLLPMSLQM